MERKYQFFISSTYVDLKPERDSVRDAILSLYQFPIGMEMFSAADEDQWEIIKETIDSSDYYILIIGKRYGTIIEHGPDKGISYTEKEYRYAKSIGIPIWVYIKNENVITADNVDIDAEKQEKLKSFIEEAKTGREVRWFSNVDQLATEVTRSIYKQIGRKKRPGWVRGDIVDLEECLNQITILNKKVHDLEEENERLLQKQNNRVPLIDIKMACHSMLSKDDNINKCTFDKSVVMELKECEEISFMDIPQKIDFSNLSDELKNTITEEEIKNYNEEIKEIEKYNNELKNYKEIIKRAVLVDFKISNKGTLKANDLNISLVFPKEIGLIERKEVIKIERPKRPVVPVSPLERRNESNLIKKAVIALAGDSNKIENHYKRRIPVELLNSDPSPIGWDFEIDKESNQVEIWIRDLLHNTEKDATELCLMVFEPGTYEIGVIIICEEFEQPIEDILTLKVY